MKELPKLTSDNVESVLQSLLAESTKEIEEPYNNQYNKVRLAYLRQAIKVVELFIEHERYNAIEKRLDHLEGFISDIKMGMFSPEAAEWIRSKNGV